MLLNVVFNFVPRPFTTAMIATEIPAAIRPYSIAVAPLLSFRKLRMSFFIPRLLALLNEPEEFRLNVLISNVQNWRPPQLPEISRSRCRRFSGKAEQGSASGRYIAPRLAKLR